MRENLSSWFPTKKKSKPVAGLHSKVFKIFNFIQYSKTYVKRPLKNKQKRS